MGLTAPSTAFHHPSDFRLSAIDYRQLGGVVEARHLGSQVGPAGVEDDRLRC